MKKALLLAAFVGIAASAQAAVVNFNFTDVPAPAQQGLNGTAWSASVAPLSYAGTSWNDRRYSFSGADVMVDSNGQATGIGYNLTGTGGDAADNWTGLKMLQGGYYSFGSMTLTISGLDQDSQYDICLVANASNSNASKFTIGSQSLSTTATSNSSFIEGDNYVRFSSISPSSGSIVVTIGATTPAIGVPVINGFQLANAVPEPTSLAVLGLAGILVLRRKP